MARLKLPFLLYLIVVIALSACSSGKSAFEHGNYYEAVITSVNRLRKNDDHAKSVETLRQAYPMAVAHFEDRAKTSLASNAEFKWTVVVESYTSINVMYDEIRRSPGALKVIPSPLNYYAKLEDAKKNAAEENYAAGIVAMTVGTREKAKVAYGLFKKANGYVPGYKDVIKMTETALWNATLKVVMEPIPVQARNISVSAEFFDDKVSEYLHSASINEFVKFYTRKEAQTLKLKPDHIVKIEFDEFVVGQVFMNEKEFRLEKDSIEVGKYVSPTVAGGKTAGGNTSGGSTSGNTSGSTSGNTGGNVSVGNISGNTGTNTGANTTGNTSGNTGNTSGANATGNTSGNTGNTSVGNTTGNTSGNSGGNTSGGNASDNKGENNSGGNKDNASGNKGGNNSGGNTDNNSGNNSSGNQDTTKVTICHIPFGNEAARHTLVISRSALKAHLDHGDTEGACDDLNKKSKDTKQKDDKKPSSKPKAQGNRQPIFYASANNDPMKWLAYTEFENEFDTTKIYTTVKATFYYYKKTTTSKGVITFRIIDTKTNALLSVEKMPGEYVWISEWATFNGDERALSPEQLQLAKQREKVPPPAQDLFIEFARPIYDQVVTKIKNFYTRY